MNNKPDTVSFTFVPLRSHQLHLNHFKLSWNKAKPMFNALTLRLFPLCTRHIQTVAHTQPGFLPRMCFSLRRDLFFLMERERSHNISLKIEDSEEPASPSAKDQTETQVG